MRRWRFSARTTGAGLDGSRSLEIEYRRTSPVQFGFNVEPGEAEWNLDVLEDLFDFYFVRPARTAAKVDALNKKLIEAGKPPMKKGSS